jgi:hypothetical protein
LVHSIRLAEAWKIIENPQACLLPVYGKRASENYLLSIPPFLNHEGQEDHEEISFRP